MQSDGDFFLEGIIGVWGGGVGVEKLKVKKVKKKKEKKREKKKIQNLEKRK